MEWINSNWAAMYIDGNADKQAVGAAAVKVDDWDGAHICPDETIVPDAVTNHNFTVKQKGYYRATYDLTVTADNTAKDAIFAVYANGVIVPGSEMTVVSLTGVLTQRVHGTGIVQCLPDQAIDLRVVQASAGDDWTFSDGTMVVERIG